jgi:hypothetical protein
MLVSRCTSGLMQNCQRTTLGVFNDEYVKTEHKYAESLECSGGSQLSVIPYVSYQYYSWYERE